MTKREERFVEFAVREAKKSTFSKNFTGAIIECNGKIISRGTNKFKTHPLQRKYDHYRLDEKFFPYSVHAEVDAIQKIIKDTNIDWNRCTIYVARILKNGETGMARPCNSCMQLIKSLGIKNVYYTTDFGVAHEYITENSKGKVYN